MANSHTLQAIKLISRNLSYWNTTGTCRPLWVKISLKCQKLQQLTSFYVLIK